MRRRLVVALTGLLRRWRLPLAYTLLLASCDSPFAPGVVVVNRVEITPSVLELGVGATTTIVARVYDEGAALLPNAKVFWSSQNHSVVTVDQAGFVTAVAPGTAQLAASSGGISQTIPVTVAQRPIALIRFTPAAASVPVGTTVPLLAEALDGTGAVLTGRVLTFATDAPEVATVNGSGVVTGVSIGTATISASGEGRTGTATVTVVPPPIVTLSIAPPGLTINAGSTSQLVATARDAQGTELFGRSLTWQSSNDAVATVSSAGLVTAISAGTVTVTVSAPNDGPQGSTPTASIPVTVNITPVATAALAPGAATVLVNQGLQFTATLFDAAGEPLSASGRQLDWSSSNTAVATVNGQGLATGVGVGSTTITLTVTTPGQGGTVQATALLSISNQPVVSVAVTPNVGTVHLGPLYARTFTAAALDVNSQPLTGRLILWTSSNLAVATVDAVTGVVTGVSPGPVQIRATSEGITGVANVTIDLVNAASVTVTPPAVTLVPPATATLTAMPRDSAGNAITGAALGGRTPAWSSSATAIATVNGNGVVTTVAEGVATISADFGGTAGQSIVTVTAKPIVTITVTPTPQTVIAGQTVLLDASAFDISGVLLPGRTFTWSSTNPAIATVDQTGLVTGVAPGGPVAIRASAEGQVGASQLTVFPRPPAKLAMSSQPSAVAQSGVLLGQQPAVQLQDNVNGSALVAGIDVTASLASGAGILSGTLVATTDASGLATFTDLVITGPAGVYTIAFSAPTLTGVTSGSVVLGAGGASQVAITTEPGAAATNAVAFAQQPVVHLQDASNNPVALAGVDIIASISSGAGTLAGAVTATTDGTGTATFTDLAIVGTVPGPFTIDFTAAGLAPATSQGITLATGAATSLAFATPVLGTATNAAPLPQQPVVRITDSGGNPVAQAGVTVTATLVEAGATLGGVVAVVTDGTGAATFTDLALTGLVGTYTIQFAATSLTAATSSAITLSAGPATQLAVTTQPSAAPMNDVVFAQQPAVQLRDVSGNAVAQAGVTVTVAITGGGAPLLGGTLTANTNASGLATFTNLKVTGVIGIRTLTFTSAPLTAATSANVDLQPGVATQLALTTAPSATANSGEVIAQQPVVQLRDLSGNNVNQAGVVIAATATPSGTVTLSGASATTGPSGAATFTTLTMTGSAGNYTLTFASGALTPAVSGTIALGAGTGAKLAIAQQPSAAAQSGVALAIQPQVQLLDASNNPVAQAGVLIFANIASGGGTLGGTTTATTNASGLATFANLNVSGLVGDRTLLFSAIGYLPIASATITISAGPASQVSIQTQPSASTPNATVFAQQPVVLVRDAAGNPVSGVVVTASLNSGAVALGGTLTATSDAAGLATFTDLMITGATGNRTLRFTIPGAIFVNSTTVAVTAGTPTSVTITTAPPATTASGATFTPSPVIRVADVSNNGVSGLVVTAAIATGAGTLGGTLTATTNASGNATFTNLNLSGLIGNRTLSFSIASPALSATSGTVTVTPGAPASLTVTQQPSSPAANDIAFVTQPSVTVRDAATNLVPGTVVTASIFSGGGTLGGTLTATANGSGVATFTNLRITGTIGDRVLRFTAAPAVVNSATVTVVAGTATQVAMQQQPSASVTNGVVFPQQPSVVVRDVSNNVVAGVTVTAAIASGAGTLGGTATAVTNASGIASFTDLVITGLVGDRTLSFTIAGPVSATSNTIAVVAGTPASLTITTQPSASVVNGVAFPVQPVIQVNDGSGNPVSGVNVTATINTGAGTLGGTTTVATNAAGTATFTNLVLTGATGNRTLNFAGAALSANSGTVTVTAGAATQVAMQVQPSPNVTSGVAFAQQPAVLVRDVSNNPVPGVTVTAAIATGAGTLGGTLTAATNASGIATFGNLVITGLVGNRTLSFTVPGPVSTTSNTVAVAAGTATQVTMQQQPSGTAASGVAFATQPSVLVRDASNNPVAGVTVTAAIASGGVTLGGTLTAATNASGIATFTNLMITGLVGDRTLSFTIPGPVSATSGTITITAGAATSLTITTQPSGSVQNAVAFPVQPVIQVNDASGNPVPNVGVTASVNTGAGVLGGTLLATTSAGGTATFTNLVLTGTIGDRTLNFAGAALSANSNTVTVTPGVATTLTVTQQATSPTANDVAFAVQPQVEARDVSNNLVPGVQVTAAMFSGGGTLGGTVTATTNGSGVASFTDLKVTGLVGDRVLQFSVPTPATVNSATITITAGAATQLIITQQPSANATADVVLAQQPIVQLSDVSGNAVAAAVQVDVTLESGTGTLGGTLSQNTSGVTGLATFTDLVINTPGTGVHTLRFTATLSGFFVVSGTITLP